MNKYNLTPKGKISGIVTFPQNWKTGDESLTIDFNKITDAQADQLMARKDGRGSQYLKQKPAPEKPATFKQKSEAKPSANPAGKFSEKSDGPDQPGTGTGSLKSEKKPGFKSE